MKAHVAQQIANAIRNGGWDMSSRSPIPECTNSYCKSGRGVKGGVLHRHTSLVRDNLAATMGNVTTEWPRAKAVDHGTGGVSRILPKRSESCRHQER
jgi:hypothetical protein